MGLDSVERIFNNLDDWRNFPRTNWKDGQIYICKLTCPKY